MIQGFALYRYKIHRCNQWLRGCKRKEVVFFAQICYHETNEGGIFMKNISEQIYLYRTKCGLSQLELAEKLDVSRQSISKWETGAAFPELPKLVKLCELFGVTLDEFVSDENPKEEQPKPNVQYVYVKPEPKNIIKPIIGALFLIPAIILFFLTDLLSAVIFAIPCVISAVVCFRKTKHTALWCVWAWFFYINCYLFVSASVRWGISFNAYYWANSPLQAIISVLLMLILMVLIAATVRIYRTYNFQFSAKKNIPLAIGALGILIIRPFVRLGWHTLSVRLFAREPIGEPTEIDGSLYFLYETIPSSQFYLVELIESLLDIALVVGLTACLVPTFYYLLHIIKEKKKIQ